MRYKKLNVIISFLFIGSIAYPILPTLALSSVTFVEAETFQVDTDLKSQEKVKTTKTPLIEPYNETRGVGERGRRATLDGQQETKIKTPGIELSDESRRALERGRRETLDGQQGPTSVPSRHSIYRGTREAIDRGLQPKQTAGENRTLDGGTLKGIPKK